MADESPNNSAGVPIYDVSTKSPTLGTIAPEEVTKAVLSGGFSLPKGKPVPVMSPDGTPGTISPEEAPQAFQNGYRYQTADDALQAKYGSTGQQIATGAEGALESGTLGLSTAVEKEFGVPPEDIRGRRAANPISHAVGQGVGLIGSAFIPGVGEAKAAQLAEEGLAAAKVINPFSAASVMTGIADRAATKMGLGGAEGLGKQIAASAVKGGIETAIFQGGDEISKMLSEDPNQSLGSAAVDIGLAGLLGGGMSGTIGSVSPLWKATSGKKLGEFISDFNGRIREHIAEGAPKPEVGGIDPFTRQPYAGPTAAEKPNWVPPEKAEGRSPWDVMKESVSGAPKAPETKPLSKDKLTPGQKAADLFIKKGLTKVLGESLGTSIGAAAGSLAGHPAIGALIGERALTPFFESVLPSIIKPMLENAASSEGLKAAVDYGVAVVRGQTIINRAAKAVFTPGQDVLASNLLPQEKDRDRLNKVIDDSQVDPASFIGMGGALGTYMADHASTLGKTAVAASDFLKSQRPVTEKKSPLDSEPVVSAFAKAEYKNALDMAQQPLLVLEKIKSGTLNQKDVLSLRTIYPGLYQNLTQKLTNELINHTAAGGTVPYATRMSLSLFLGQPLDSSMTPESLLSIQAQFQMPQKGSEANEAARAKHSTASLSKGPKQYLTAAQAAQARRAQVD